MDKEGGFLGVLRLAGNPFISSFHEQRRLSLALAGAQATLLPGCCLARRLEMRPVLGFHIVASARVSDSEIHCRAAVWNAGKSPIKPQMSPKISCLASSQYSAFTMAFRAPVRTHGGWCESWEPQDSHFPCGTEN